MVSRSPSEPESLLSRSGQKNKPDGGGGENSKVFSRGKPRQIRRPWVKAWVRVESAAAGRGRKAPGERGRLVGRARLNA